MSSTRFAHSASLRTSLCTLIVAFVALASTLGRAEPAKTISIQNEFLRLTVDAPSGRFTIDSVPMAKPIISDGFVGVLSPTATVGASSDAAFGAGQTIVVTDSIGSCDLTLYPHVPFVLVRRAQKNTTAQTKVINEIPVTTFDIAADAVGASPYVRGTGGLSAFGGPAGSPRSYEWIALAGTSNPKGVVAGFLTHDRATGVLSCSAPSLDHPRIASTPLLAEITADNQFGHLEIPPGSSASTETLAIGYFPDARLGLEAWADAIAKIEHIKLPPQPTGYCTWYSDNNGGSGNEKSIAELSEFVKKELAPFGFNFIQIDDGWQQGDSRKNGPRKNFTAFRTDGPYPGGMKATADRLKADGVAPGIWFMPFAGTYNDPWFKDHQDWFAKTKDGKPYDTAWGGTCLDMTNPAAKEYVRHVVKTIAGDWGYTYFKLDGMWTGLAAKQIYVNSSYKEDGFGDAVLFDKTKTNIQAIRDGLKLVRETAGPKVFLLGCNIAQNMRSYGATFGLLDAMRIGPDNNGSWKGWSASPLFGSRHYFLNGRVWYNDPDPNYVRAKLTTDEARTIATWVAVSGQLNTNSDWIPGLPPDRLDLLKRTMPAHGKTARPVDFFENDPPRVWQAIDDKSPARRDLIALYNWEDKETTFDLPLSRFELPPAKEYAVFDYWANRFLPPMHDSLKATLASHGCLDLAIRPMLDHPFLLSTSRHITQGMEDVTGEQWNPQTKTLSGQSRLVAGDSYELRIVAPGTWKAAAIELSSDDVAAGVQSHMVQADAGVRATITAAAGRTVAWKVMFRE